MACNVGRILHALLWILLNTTFIGCQQNAVITASQTSLTEGDPLILTCRYTGIDNESAILWYNKTVGNFFVLKPNSSMSSNCSFFSKGPSFESNRVSYTCDFTNNIYTLAIASVQMEDAGLWFCTFQDPFPGSPTSNIILQVTATTTTSTSTTTTTKPTTASSTSYTSDSYTSNVTSARSPLPIILTPSLVGVAVIVILLILFCCGCLDCCKCCRIFDHYEVSNSCYVTWYFIKRGCCSFFFCKSGSKRGKCFCGDHKGERCGGCLPCRNKFTCGWPGNCKTMDSSCGGYWFCSCCGTPRRDEEDPLVVCTDNNDALCRPADDKMTITCSVNGYGPDDIISAWTGPQGNELTNSTKHKITPYNKDTGKSSLTISAFCNSDNGQYTCQVTDGDGFSVKDSISITVHDTERNTNRTGAPGIHIGTGKKVKPETTSKKTKDRPQPLPSVARVTEDIPKYRPQPKPPENLRGISANVDDSRGLPIDIPRSSRLPPLTHNQSTVEEEDASEKPKKKKNKKKKKSKVNEGKSEEETDESKSKRTLPEDQSVED